MPSFKYRYGQFEKQFLLMQCGTRLKYSQKSKFIQTFYLRF